jgi:hypothetical protein
VSKRVSAPLLRREQFNVTVPARLSANCPAAFENAYIPPKLSPSNDELAYLSELRASHELFALSLSNGCANAVPPLPPVSVNGAR